MDYSSNEAMRQDQYSGEHLEGTTRLAEEESRKNKYFSMFHSGREHMGENHGDRNKMGSRDKQSGYE